ncbi:hypothetical protein Tco_1213747 [Tanacetum coccineum]
MPSIRRIDPIRYAVSSPQNRMQFFKPNQSIIPFPNRLIDDSYEENMVLVELVDREKSVTNFKMLLNENSRMGYQIKASTNMQDSAILEDSLPPKEKDPGSLGELAPTKLIIELDDRTIKHPNGLRERMELDLEARLMGETLILNRSLDPTYGDYIEFNDPNEPLELRINQVEYLGIMIEEGEVIDEPIEDIVKTRNYDNEISNGIDEYPSFCDFDRKIHIDCAYNLQFSCMIDKVKFKGKNVVGAFINVPIFVGNFSVVTDFAVMENIDAYCDEGMGDAIVGKTFCREICVKARRFDGMIIICNGNDGVTYQMARSHSRFIHLTNAQCNKMRPLLKVSAHDKLNGISNPYQKLKSFYKGVLNLGPKYIRDAKIEELLTRGHASIHEME